MASNTLPKPAAPLPPKPVTRIWRPELTQLPRLHFARRIFRRFVRWIARLILRLITSTTITGLQRFPSSGPALLAVNHLGDADAAILLAALPVAPDVLGKVEMIYDFPIVGRLMDWYGVIWLHRGRPDRRALHCALDAFAQGRFLIIAPEGRYSLVKGLEPGGKGAAYLATKANVPVIPIALTGTENANVYSSLRRFRRPHLSITIGERLILRPQADDRLALEEDTRQIMEAIAALLPPDYRGAYR
ncbi:MAG: lysophospholipid acyltransferase family protein [Anaerolineales bacterium]